MVSLAGRRSATHDIKLTVQGGTLSVVRNVSEVGVSSLWADWVDRRWMLDVGGLACREHGLVSVFAS